MENYKFTSLLAATPLSDEDKYNLALIFSRLRPDRQIDIMDHWDQYLDRILLIHTKAEDERKRQIQETFARINAMIDDAYQKEQVRKQQESIEQAKKDADMNAAIEYDQKRKLEAIRKKEQEQELAREKLLDPLSFL